MTIASMTGFARRDGDHAGIAWSWEARSVNARGLDVRCRLPAGFEAVDQAARQRISQRLSRGSVTFTLSLTWPSGGNAIRINMAVLDQILALLPEILTRVPTCRSPSPEGLLSLRGVIEAEDPMPQGEARAALEQDLIAALDGLLDDLIAARSGEGMRLATVLREQLGRILALRDDALALAALQPEAILTRLKEQVTQLAETVPTDRLVQEAALLAVKADAREELDRIGAHVAAAQALLDRGSPVGRKLDFLCQEFNREANTLCAKSSDVSLTRIGIDMKTTVEQFREQVQNIE